MTESDWASSTDPRKMLRFMRGVSRRKWRLLAVACCRHLFAGVIADGRTRSAIEVAESYAEGAASKEAVAAARRAATAAREASWRAKRAAWWANYGRPAAAVHGVLEQPVPPPWRRGGAGAPKERPAPLPRPTLAPLSALVRDIVGDPLRPPPAIDPAWLAWDGGTVAKLARDGYDSRHLPAGTLDVTRLGVLADALEEAGCADAAILAHLRGPGPHVRGCHVLDLLLGRG